MDKGQDQMMHTGVEKIVQIAGTPIGLYGLDSYGRLYRFTEGIGWIELDDKGWTSEPPKMGESHLKEPDKLGK